MASVDIDLVINTANGANSVKDIRTQMKALKNAMLEVGEDSAEFNRLAQAAAELEDKMGDVNERMAAFNPDGFAALTGFASKAAGAVGAVTGAMALFGAESEDVQKAMMKVQAAMQMTQGIESIKGLGKAFKALWAVVVANPIVALVTAMVALGAAAFAVYKSMTETSEATERANEAYEAQVKLTSEVTQQQEREIALLTAQGASTDEIVAAKKKLLEAQIAELKSNNALHESKLQDIEDNNSVWESILDVTAATMDFIGEEKAAENARNLIAENKAERAEEELKLIEENNAKIYELETQLLVLDTEVETKKREEGKKTYETKKELREKEAAEHAALMDKILIDEIALGDALVAEQEDINARIAEAENQRAKNHRDYIEAKKLKEQEAHDHRKALHEAEQKREQMVAKARLDAVAGLFGSLSQLAGKNQKLMKSFSVAEATINTYKGVTAALADPLLPFPIKLINAAAVLASGIANVRKILAVEPGSSGGGTVAPAMSNGGGGIAAINTPPAQPQPSTQLDQNGNVIGGNGNQQQQPQRVYVVETDIRETLGRVAVIEQSVSHR